jgi:hypothetical protein
MRMGRAPGELSTTMSPLSCCSKTCSPRSRINPDELVWGHVKSRVAKATVQTQDELKNMVQRTLRRLQKLPNVVAGFFRAPTCRYAAV